MVVGALLLGVGLTLLVVALTENGPTTVYVLPSTTQPPSTVAAVAPTSTAPPTTSEPQAPPTTTPQTVAVRLGMSDFTAACREQYQDGSAVAKIARTPTEPPAYWVKCFIRGANVGGLSLDDYCPTIQPGTRSETPKRGDWTATNDGWLFWECIPA